MRDPTRALLPLAHAIFLAHMTALVFGVSLLAWGFAPVILHRLTSNQPPRMELFAVSSFTVLSGLVYIGLAMLIWRRVAWGLRGSLWLSLILLVAILTVAMLDVGSVSLFPLLLSISSGLTAVLALVRLTDEPVMADGSTAAVPRNAPERA